MAKDRVTEIELQDVNQIQEYCIKIDDKAATRQAIINYIEENLMLESSNKFIERSEWHAKEPKKELHPDWDYTDIVIHHQGNSSIGTECVPAFEVVNEIQHKHMSGKFDDIGYHYIVACDGQIAEGRDIRFQGSHVLGNNSHKIGILLAGDYSQRNEVNITLGDIFKRREINDQVLDYMDFFHATEVPPSQVHGLEILISALISVFCIDRLGGHREFALSGDHRTCPGNIAMQLVQKLRSSYGLLAP